MDLKKSLENEKYLTDQLITYIGNKRALLTFIQEGLSFVQEKLGKKRFSTFDVFSGSGIVSRLLKQYSTSQLANDMENYGRIISQCYLSNAREIDLNELKNIHESLNKKCLKSVKKYLTKDECAFADFQKLPGFISSYYAPKDMLNIQSGERCFYTPYNACYIDCMRQLIEKNVPDKYKVFFIAPLLSQASVHANTGGVFKGFYKNSKTGIGKFGGNGENALSRIEGRIDLPFPVFSTYKSKVSIFQSEANSLVSSEKIPEVDLAYIDPPYNQHPYGSNYFMLNLIADYKKPDESLLSKVSGIPKDWNRSMYNKKKYAAETFLDLVSTIKAKFLLVSFNNEGFIPMEEMTSLLNQIGKVTVMKSDYNAYRASRNLKGRNIHTTEYLYIVEKGKS